MKVINVRMFSLLNLWNEGYPAEVNKVRYYKIAKSTLSDQGNKLFFLDSELQLKYCVGAANGGESLNFLNPLCPTLGREKLELIPGQLQ